MKSRVLAATVACGAVLLSTAVMGGSAVASSSGGSHSHAVHARLNSLNDSGATGRATVKVQGKKVDVYYAARGLARKLPHAAHIHYGAEARHECPTVKNDTNHDFRLNVAEGLPEYGPIAISLTTRGDTSAAKSALAVDRFLTAPKGKIHYQRVITTSKAVARGISRGDAVLVIHGVDYNNNGKYDFRGAGKSELDPKLPAEATDPAVCGVLR